MTQPKTSRCPACSCECVKTFILLIQSQGEWPIPVILALEKLRLEDREFKIILYK